LKTNEVKFETLVELSRKAEGMNPTACFGVHTRDFNVGKMLAMEAVADYHHFLHQRP
jgi:hypothetical protein